MVRRLRGATRTALLFPFTTLVRSRGLFVGPFQGKPACVRVALGKGVCGAAARLRETQIVSDVNAFAGHIACDTASQSEIVVPLLRGDELLGVLDLDSPTLARFDAQDRTGLEALARSEAHTSELQSLMRRSYAGFCLKKKKQK